jgi:hypothetical protein
VKGGESMQETERLMVVGLDTGVIYEENIASYKTQEQAEREEKYRSAKPNNGDNCFVWFLFNASQQIFPELLPQEITRLIYMATYINYEDNILIDNDGKNITPKTLKDIMKLSNNQYYPLINKLQDLDILIIKDEYIKISDSVFRRGKIDGRTIRGLYKTKLYIGIIRKLYEKANRSEDKRLSYLFQLIPYVNLKYNLACKNICETNIYEIQFLTLQDFAEIIGYGTSEDSVRRLKHNLSKITVKHALAIAFLSSKDLGKSIIFINKDLYCAGNKNEINAMVSRFFSQKG